MMNKKGFSLMELLVVVIIIAGFAAMTYPSYVSSIERARVNEAVQMLGTIQAAQQKHFVNYEEYGTTFKDISDFTPAVENFDETKSTFDTEYFRYSISGKSVIDPKAKAERIDKMHNLVNKGYRLEALYAESFVRCIIVDNSMEGKKVCSSLTDKEQKDDYFPIY